MNPSKRDHIESYFEKLRTDFTRAKRLYSSKVFRLEGMIVLFCQISALSKQLYPSLADNKAFKTIIEKFSGHYDVFENIDLLFFYQQPNSKTANDHVYSKLENYDKLRSIFETEFGGVESIKNSSNRYQKRESLRELLECKKLCWFKVDNFLEFIELFSNNQIFYTYGRCDAVHNNEFPLINIGVSYPSGARTYEDNHQISGKVIVESLGSIISNLKEECLSNKKWLHQLYL